MNRAVVVGLLGLVCACGRPEGEPTASLSLTETLGGADTVGYARAVEPRAFVFPADHGPHPDFRTEWWYVTGNLTGSGNREVGFQFTIFRSALAPSPPDIPSGWATNQAYMGHLAVTDVESGRFHAFESFARGSGGLAGAAADPFRVWIEGWSLEGPADGGAAFPMRLRAADGTVALDLTFEAGKPRVLQGQAGLSQKGPEPGNASYYYAHTRMPARGTVVLGADTLTVSGLGWLDREWSTSSLSEGQVGWDWFALQMDDGWDLMVYQLRNDDGTAHPLSDGVLVSPEGTRVPLAWGRDIQVEPTGRWTSPRDGSVYPSGWRIAIPSRDWDVTVTPVMDDQELVLAFRYWEGAVRVEGTAAGRDASGRGYVELTGYAGQRPGR
ncbi:MAG: lipocalin-like domain-containing protein [Longimicrobiales bacterium]